MRRTIGIAVGSLAVALGICAVPAYAQDLTEIDPPTRSQGGIVGPQIFVDLSATGAGDGSVSVIGPVVPLPQLKGDAAPEIVLPETEIVTPTM